MRELADEWYNWRPIKLPNFDVQASKEDVIKLSLEILESETSTDQLFSDALELVVKASYLFGLGAPNDVLRQLFNLKCFAFSRKKNEMLAVLRQLVPTFVELDPRPPEPKPKPVPSPKRDQAPVRKPLKGPQPKSRASAKQNPPQIPSRSIYEVLRDSDDYKPKPEPSIDKFQQKLPEMPEFRQKEVAPNGMPRSVKDVIEFIDKRRNGIINGKDADDLKALVRRVDAHSTVIDSCKVYLAKRNVIPLQDLMEMKMRLQKCWPKD